MCTICIWTCEVRGGLVQLEHHKYTTNNVNAQSTMIKGIEHMYAIDQSKLRESKTFSSFATYKMFSHPTAWDFAQIVAKVPEGLPHPKQLRATLSCGNVLGLSGG
jgi:hypothetical protein